MSEYNRHRWAMEWMYGGGRDPHGRSLDEEIKLGKEEWTERQRVAQGGRIGLQSGQLVQPGLGRPGFMEGKLVTQGKHKGEWVIYHSTEGTQYFKSKTAMNKWIKDRPGKGDPTVGKRSQHPDFPRPTKGKILSKNEAKLKKLKELIKDSNSSYTKNLTAHEILVKAGWEGGYQDIGTYQKIRPEVAKAMEKFQTNFEKMDNYVTNVMLAEDALVKDFRNPMTHIAEKFGASEGTVHDWRHGNKTGTWKGSKVFTENKQLFDHLGKELSFNKYKSLSDGTPRLIWDMSEIIQNKLPIAFAGPGEYLPHKFIMDSAHRHNTYAKHAGKSSQVRFIDKNYELLPRNEWKFIKGNKLYSMDAALDDVVYDGTTYKNNYLNHADAPNLYKNDFGDVYRAFDDLDIYMNTKVPDPKNPKKQILLDTLLRRQAYDETGKQDFLKRRFAELDHFDGVDKKPFSNIRLLDRRTNARAGMVKRFDKYKKNPQLLNKTLTDIGYLHRDKDNTAFIKRMTKKAGVSPQIVKQTKLVSFPANLADVKWSKNVKGWRGGALFEILFGVLDYWNEQSKGKSKSQSKWNAIQNITFGILKTGDKKYVHELLKLGKEMGFDTTALEHVIDINKRDNVLAKVEASHASHLEAIQKKIDKTTDPEMKEKLQEIYNERKMRFATEERLRAEETDKIFNTYVEDLRAKKAGPAQLVSPEKLAATEITQEEANLPFKQLWTTAMEQLGKEKTKAFPAASKRLDYEAGAIGDPLQTYIFNAPAWSKKHEGFGYIGERTPKQEERAHLNSLIKLAEEGNPEPLREYNERRGVYEEQPISKQSLINLTEQHPWLGYRVEEAEGGIATLLKK